MNTVNFNKIVIVSLCDRFTISLSKSLAQSLQMMFCNTKDLIEYELIDKKELKKFSTKEYLDKAEQSVIKHIASFNNVLVSINFDQLTRNYQLFKENSVIIFVKLPKIYIEEKSNIINKISYDSRTKSLEQIATLTISVKKTQVNFVAEKILEKLGEIL